MGKEKSRNFAGDFGLNVICLRCNGKYGSPGEVSVILSNTKNNYESI